MNYLDWKLYFDLANAVHDGKTDSRLEPALRAISSALHMLTFRKET